MVQRQIGYVWQVRARQWASWREWARSLRNTGSKWLEVGLLYRSISMVMVYDAPNMEALMKLAMESEAMGWSMYTTTEMRPVMTLEETMKFLK